MKTSSLRSVSLGISLFALMVGYAPTKAMAVPTGVIVVNTTNTLPTETNGAISTVGGSNPIYNTANGTATLPVFTYAGSGNAAMSIGGTILANAGNYGVVVTGSNAHGAADVTSSITFTGSSTGAGAGGGFYWASTGQYNFFTLANGATLTSGTSGTESALMVASGTSMNVNNNGTIIGQGAIDGVQTDASNTGAVNITNNAGGTISSTTGSAIYIPTGAGAFDTTVAITGGTVSAGGNAGVINLANVAANGDTVNVSGGTVSSAVGTAPGIDVSSATGHASTINVSGGTIQNTSGATGAAIQVGQSGDVINITGGSIQGVIQTATNGNGTVNFNDTAGFSTNGTLGHGNNANNLAAVNVNGGSVTFNNNVYANTFNFAGGTATVGAGITTNATTINFGGGTLALGTNILTTGVATLTTSTAPSTIDLTLGSSANGKIVSTGALTNSLAAGGQTVTITPTVSGITPMAGNEFVVLKGTTNTSNLAVTNTNSNSILAGGFVLGSATSGTDAYHNAITGNNVILTYTGTRDAHTLAYLDTNQANAINAAIATNGPAGLSNALLALTSGNQVAQAGSRLSSESNRGSIEGATAAVNGALNTVSDRLDALRDAATLSGYSSGEAPKNLGIWVQGFGDGASQGSRGGSDGYNLIGGGLAFGADTLVAKNVRAGASFAYGHTAVDDTGALDGDSTGINSYLGTVYGSYQGAPWYVDGAFNFGYHHYDTERLVTFTGFDDNANGTHNGYQYTAKFNGGYPIELKPVTLTPMLGVTYTHLDQSSYSESSTGGSALSVGSLSDNSVKSSVGGRVAETFLVNDYKLRPEFNAAWVHEYVNTALQTNDAYVAGGSAFTTTEVHPAADSALLGINLVVETKDNISLTASYTAELRSGYLGNTGILNLRKDF